MSNDGPRINISQREHGDRTESPGNAPADRSVVDPYRNISEGFTSRPADYFANYLERTGTARLVIETPNPLVTLSLGKPHENFGYIGLSIRAEDHLWLETGRKARYQHGDDVSVVAQRLYTVLTMQDLALGADKNAVMAGRRKAIVAAGAGYGIFPDLSTGNIPASQPFNWTGFNDICDPARWGLRDFDELMDKQVWKCEAELGYRPPPPVENPAAKAALTKWQMIFGADATPPTRSQGSFDRILDINTLPLLGTLNKLTKMVDRVSMWASRPDMMPLVGGIFTKIKQIKEGVRALNEIMALPEFKPAVDSFTPTWNKEKGKMEAHKKQGDWLSVVSTDWRVMLTQPVREFRTQLTRLKNGIKELLEAVAGVLGLMAPPPSALGLVGQDGITMVAGTDMLAWAPNGFHFVSAKNAKDWPMDITARLAKKLREVEQGVRDKLGAGLLANFLLGKENPLAPETPNFTVETEGKIGMYALRGIIISGVGDASVVRLESTAGTEVAALGPVSISSRRAMVEVMGREVHIGIPSMSDAKNIAKAQMTLVAAQETTKTTGRALRDASVQLSKAERKLAKTTEDIDAIKTKWAGELRNPGPGTLAKLSAMRVERASLEAKQAALVIEVEAKKVAVAAAKKADDSADAAYVLARQATKIDAMAPKAFGWEPGTQTFCETFTAAASKEAEIFAGDKAKLTSHKSIVLETDTKIPPTAKKATITIETEIELKVGDFVVKVEKDKVTIQAGNLPTAPKVLVETSGITLDAGTNPIKMKGAGLEGDATGNVKLSGSKVMLG